MKNIHIIPTDKPSRLSIIDSQLVYSKEYFLNPQHIYIISSDVIREGDYTLMFDDFGRLFLCDKPQQYLGIEKGHHLNKGLRKIILTTDQDLINDGIQEIDETFLEWYVKNPSCEYVEVSEDYFKLSNMVYGHNTEHYKIIIPKEPKPIHQQIIYIVGGEDRFREIANLKPKQETLKKVEENIDREEWINFFKNNSKEEILEYLIDYKFPL